MSRPDHTELVMGGYLRVGCILIIASLTAIAYAGPGPAVAFGFLGMIFGCLLISVDLLVSATKAPEKPEEKP